MACATTHAADDLRIVTEELPPYNMTLDGEVTGLSTEIVKAVVKQAGLHASIQSMPWARAYDTALNSENVLIYSILRTPGRESLFKWVGSIAQPHWYLMSMAGREVKLKTLDDARNYQIATVNEDAGEQYLLANGFVVGKNLQSSGKYESGYDKLKLGRVALWITEEPTAVYLVHRQGDDPAKTLVRALSLPGLESGSGLNMAFGVKTSDALVARLRVALETIKKNGVYDAIQQKWR